MGTLPSDVTPPVALKMKDGIFVICRRHVRERSHNRHSKLSLLCKQGAARFNIEWMIQNGFLIQGK